MTLYLKTRKSKVGYIKGTYVSGNLVFRWHEFFMNTDICPNLTEEFQFADLLPSKLVFW